MLTGHCAGIGCGFAFNLQLSGCRTLDLKLYPKPYVFEA